MVAVKRKDVFPTKVIRVGESIISLNSREPQERITVLSTDPWLDRLHGASILSLFKVLSRFKYRIKVLLPSTSNRLIEDGSLQVVGFEVKRYIPLFSLISLCCRDLRIMFREKPTLVIFDFPMLPLFLLSRILWKSKGIMLILSRPIGEEGFKGWLRLLHFRLSLMLGKIFVNAFTAISPFEALEFSVLGKIPKSKVIVIPSPLGEEFEKFNPPENINELRRRLGFDAFLSKKVLLYHGALDGQRGVLQLVKLFADSFKKNNEVVLLLVGDGPAKHLIERFIHEYKVDNIILLGTVPYSKMPELIAACDAGVVLLPDHPWWRYQCPTKLVELLALGKPVVASELPGIKWIANGSPIVKYINTISAQDFKRSVEEALGVRIGDVFTRQITIERFSSKALASRLSLILNEMLYRE